MRIYHSRDLVCWRLASKPLRRRSQLDLSGVPDSGGVWAPDLSWKNGLFHLVYTNVAHWSPRGGPFDTPNFVVTCDRIDGEWSEPVFLNASGFDPSLFHDEDGRSWLLNMIWDGRLDRNPFAGIVLQEYDISTSTLVGEAAVIFGGTSLGSTEGPRLYKRQGWYYLVTAEGGTSYEHAVTVARSRFLRGPYDVHPRSPILTSRDDPSLPLQKAGHASFMENPDGSWYMAHLASRPLSSRGRCPLGRETCLQRLRWSDDGWPELHEEGRHPRVEVPIAVSSAATGMSRETRDDFEIAELSAEYDVLRTPLEDDRCSLSIRPGWLRLRGGASLRSPQGVSMVARRLSSLKSRVTAKMEFSPENHQQSAGLALYYDTKNHCALALSKNDQGVVIPILATCFEGAEEMIEGERLVGGSDRVVHLRAVIDHASLRFLISEDGETWMQIGPDCDTGRLSDDACGGFTGTFAGLFCVDRSRRSVHADFDFFACEERF